MFDVFWLPYHGFNNETTQFSSGTAHVSMGTLPSLPESRTNTRLVVMNDSQLSCILSALSSADYDSNWTVHYRVTGGNMRVLPDSPLGQGEWFGLPVSRIGLNKIEGSYRGFTRGRINTFISELKEQLMVDVRPELNAMIEAQNEMSDDLDAIRIHLQTIAESIDGTAAEKLEDIVNALGLLVALL